MRHVVIGVVLLAASPAAAQFRYRVGETVEANPTQIASGWGNCRILEQGPGPGTYKVTCLMPWSREKEYWSEGYTSEKWIRPISAAAARMTPAQAAAAGGAYRIGQTVLGAPGHIDATWTRCVVLDRMPGVAVGSEPVIDSYKLNCVVASADPYGRPTQWVQEAWVKATWMKPDNPAFHPERTLASARGAEAARTARLNRPAAPRRADGAATAVRPGSYECWANGSARMNLNFTVTGAGSYRNAGGSGRFGMDAATKRVTFTGPLGASMPAGFVAVYHEPGGRPTVSFRSPRGAEAAFCEKP